MDIQRFLPVLVPKAVAYAKKHESVITTSGHVLSEYGFDLARRVGVARPDLVRLMIVPEVPAPEDPELREMAIALNLLGPQTHGIALGYGIYMVQGHEGTRLASHELRHVYQYEQYGGIDGFMPVYLAQIARHGYRNSPMEQDARAHEIQPPPQT